MKHYRAVSGLFYARGALQNHFFSVNLAESKRQIVQYPLSRNCPIYADDLQSKVLWELTKLVMQKLHEIIDNMNIEHNGNLG